MALMSKGGGVGVVGRLDTDSARALPPGPLVPHMCDDWQLLLRPRKAGSCAV